MKRSPMKRSTKRPEIAPPRWREAKQRGCHLCQRRTVAQHHVVYRQHVRQAGGDEWDPRNSMSLCQPHHVDHHSRTDVIALASISQETWAFAQDTFGVGPAEMYFARYYA